MGFLDSFRQIQETQIQQPSVFSEKYKSVGIIECNDNTFIVKFQNSFMIMVLSAPI